MMARSHGRDSMFSRAMVILYLPMPVATVAQERQGVIYKCVDRAGRVACQTDRCRPGIEVRGAKVFTDRGIDPNLARKVEADRRALAARRRQTPGCSFGVPRGVGQGPPLSRGQGGPRSGPQATGPADDVQPSPQARRQGVRHLQIRTGGLDERPFLAERTQPLFRIMHIMLFRS